MNYCEEYLPQLASSEPSPQSSTPLHKPCNRFTQTPVVWHLKLRIGSHWGEGRGNEHPVNVISSIPVRPS